MHSQKWLSVMSGRRREINAIEPLNAKDLRGDVLESMHSQKWLSVMTEHRRKARTANVLKTQELLADVLESIHGPAAHPRR
jgi:hypothetical protein